MEILVAAGLIAAGLAGLIVRTRQPHAPAPAVGAWGTAPAVHDVRPRILRP